MEEKQMILRADATEKLFYEDGYQKEFTAVVRACEADGDGWQVVLDRTAFFPEGGGQFGDIGWLDDAEVSDTPGRGDATPSLSRLPVVPLPMSTTPLTGRAGSTICSSTPASTFSLAWCTGCTGTTMWAFTWAPT